MTEFLVVYVYKPNTSNNFFNLTYFSNSAPVLSEIQLKIIEKHHWGINDFAIINIMPIKTELNDLK